MAHAGALAYPIIAVNDADTKHLFDNRYGTGQSTIDGITRATNVLWAGKNVVVCGYGWCGRGVAMRARGMGSQVIVTEVDPVRALEAVMDGFHVMPMLEAAPHRRYLHHRHRRYQRHRPSALRGDEGRRDTRQQRPLQRGNQHPGAGGDGRGAARDTALRRGVTASADGKRLFLLGEGRLINLAAAEGHPASVMDMSFANQALCAEHLALQEKKLPARRASGAPGDRPRNRKAQAGRRWASASIP